MNRIAQTIAAVALLAVALGAGAGEPLRPWNGGPPPPLALKSPAGIPIDLARLRGKVVLVNFWATWCAPCVEEMPALARLRERLASRGFEVIAVNQGEMPARVRAFTERTGLDLPIVMDRDKEASKAWKVRALPTTFVVDAAGRVRLFAEGELDTGEALEAAILPLLPRERPTSAAR
jgi:thiol-disulfide isomerase/thioredoxin